MFLEQARIKTTAKRAMIEVMYHNLSKVSKMYTSTFGIVFPRIDELSKAVMIRHDLVHRNGKSPSGGVIKVDKQMVDDLIVSVSRFCQEIAKALQLI